MRVMVHISVAYIIPKYWLHVTPNFGNVQCIALSDYAKYSAFTQTLQIPLIAKLTMATTTMTVAAPRSKKHVPKGAKLPPESERYMRACADIASALIQDYEAQSDGSKPKKDINLNALRGQMAKRHHLSTQPPLTAIIAAVPEHYKKYILPKLIAKPISKSFLTS